MTELNTYLQHKIKELNGTWISKNSGYEKEACINLGFTCETKRYWDCKYNDTYIEIKKGKSIWLNEVRYCEIVMNSNEDCKKKTFTIFIIPSKNKTIIDTIYIIDTQKLIHFMKLTPEWAVQVLCRYKETGKSLNYQYPMTIKELREIADFKISNVLMPS